MHYDIGTLSLWIGVGVALMVGGIQAAGWRHRAVILGLIGAGVLCIAAAILWPLLADFLPSVASFMSRVAASPNSWFTLGMFVVAVVLFTQLVKPAVPQSIDLASLGRADSEIRLQDSAKKFESYTESRFTGLDGGMQSIWQEIHSLKNEGAAQHETFVAAIANIQGQIAIDLPNASTVAEAFRNLDEAVHLKVERVHDEVKRLREELRSDDMDLIFLLNFAVDSVSIRFLDRIISENPLSRVKNVAQYDDPKERERDRLLLEKYVRDVLGWLRPNTHIGMMATDVAKEGESEVDSNLNNDPPDARPANVDPIVLRRFIIPQTQCAKLDLFLKWQRGQLAGELTAQRDGLMQQQSARKTAKTLSLLKASSSS